MNLEVYPDSEKLSRAAAELFVRVAREAVEKRGRFCVALSGGSSPEATYYMLSSKTFENKIPWDKAYIFWGDERFVPPEDPQNNARMARETLLDHVAVPEEQVFPIPTGDTPEEAASQYSDYLHDYFDGEDPRFDLIFLGLGENGHTASLFPEKPVLHNTENWVAPVYLEDKDQYRITLTAPVLNYARNAAFLVYGKNKAGVVAKILEGEHQPEKLPAQLVKLSDGTLYWLLDEAAASELKQPRTSK